jgi:putative peptide zinc metalloprotease protein
MCLTLNSTLSLVQIEIRKDKTHYIVEDKTSAEFYEMPDICIDAINLINGGVQLGDIEQHLKGKYPTEKVDLIDFAEQLIEMQLIAEIDGVKLEKNLESKKERLGFLWISPKIGKFFFNKATYIVYAALFIINVFLFISKPVLFPHYKDLFIFDYMMLNIPAWILLTFILVLIHEFGHILAMRAQNLPTKIEVGHRLFLVVLETDMSSVWKLPSKNRNVLFLAGLCFDTLILSLALIFQLIFANGSEVFLSILSVVVLDTFIRMVYQLCIYMKTDLYYVFENISGCYNLMENAQQVIRRWFPFLKNHSTEDVVFEGERKTVLAYSIFYFVGVALTVSLYTIFYIPQVLFAVKKVIPGYLEGPTSLPFWDATLFTIQILIGFLLLFYSWRKKYGHS